MTRSALARLAAPAILLAAATLAACAGPRRTNGAAPRGGRGELTRGQIMERGYTNLYDAVQALRGQWLVTRGVDSFASPTQVVVYFGNTRLGGIEALRSITPASVATVRRFDGTTASARWWLGHGQGVIQVTPIEP